MKMINSQVGILLILILLSTPGKSYADELIDSCNNEITIEEKKSKLWLVNLTGIGIVTAWGVANWDYFSESPQTTSEGWFGNDTKYGGADKLGHAYSSYVLTHGLSNLYDSWCFNKSDAARYGALSSLVIVTYVELGDSFSNFGASKEDMISNILGVSVGYFTDRNPRLSISVDFRWEYKLNKESFGDFTTDYENSKYLLALKLNGFDFARSSFLKHIEFHAGYYTRGFSDPGATKERNVFVGIGLNLTDMFRRHSYNKAATLFKYYQIPATSIEVTNDLND